MKLVIEEGHVDLDHAVVVRDGVRTSLSAMENRLLRYLAENEDRSVSQEELLEEVWGYAATTVSRTVRTTVGRVRQKIERDPAQPVHLLTEYGEGYRLVQAQAPALKKVAAQGAALGFVGRTAELERLRSLTEGDQRLVSLVGMGGIGKTRLARVWMEQTELPCVFVDAAQVRNVAELMVTWGQQLGFPEGAVSEQQLWAALEAHGACLWVLDNLEQVSGGSALIRACLAGTTQVRLLVTTRKALGAPEEYLIEVGPLMGDDAVQMVTDRCNEVGRTVDPVTDRPALVELATRLDGVPLALELACAWTAALPLAELVSRLEPDLLSDDVGSRPERHRSIAAVFEGSWQLLSSQGQQALVYASVFGDGFLLDDLEAVMAKPALMQVRELRRASLLRLEGERYRVLKVTRAEVARRSPALHDEAVVAHRDHFAAMAMEIRTHTFRAERESALDVLIAEWSNLMVALRTASRTDPDLARSMAMALDPLANSRLGWSTELENVSRVVDHPLLEVGLARSLRQSGRSREAIDLLETKAARYIGPFQVAIRDEWIRSLIAVGQLEDAESMGRTLLSEDIPDRYRGRILRSLATIACEQGEFQQSLTLYREALRLIANGGDRLEEALCRSDLGDLLGELGDEEVAEIELRDALLVTRQERSRASELVVWGRLAKRVAVRDVQTGRAMWVQQAQNAERLGRTRLVTEAWLGIGQTYIDEGNVESAQAILTPLLDRIRSHESRWMATMAWALLTCASAESGEVEMTRSRAEQALAQADPGRKRGAWVHLWCGLALWRVGDRTRGKQHLQRVAQHPQWSATPGLCISAFLMGEAPDSNLATASYRGAIEAFEGPGVPESEQDSWITRTLQALAARSESRGPPETTES